MSDGYEILSLGELEPVPYHARGGQKLLTIQRLLNFRVAGINGWIGNVGEGLVPKHSEDSDNEELYVVVRGRATFTVDGKEVDATAGTLLHLLPGEEREAVSAEAGTIVVAIGATIGQPYEPQGWTHFVVADHHRREGRLDEGRAAMQQMLAEHPDIWGAPYNMACYAAFAYLKQALQLDTQTVRNFAPGDEDLDSLHDDPRWKKLVG